MTTSKRFQLTRAAAAVAFLGAGSLALGLTGCGTAVAADDADTDTLTYWMWDSNQIPGYQKCATAFEQQNPDILINIEQYGWGDYWTQLTARMVAESAPDVFVDHAQQFGKYASFDQILDISEYIEESGLDMDQYQDGLTDLWKGEDGGIYGLPKDWDTVGLFYNADMLADAGYTAEDLEKLEWNPKDGGTFEKFLAHMTIDQNGVRGDEEGFDPNRVATYGLGYNEAGDGFGQVQWAAFAFSTGWYYGDQNPWPRQMDYDDPRFKETIDWYRGLIKKGYIPPLSIATSGIGTLESLGSGGYATLIEGSWNARAMSEMGGVNVQVAPTPIGPQGKRASMFNGLSDAVYAGTDHPDKAWRWVEYLASRECQDMVADEARVFPAIKESSDRAVAKFEELGINAEAFNVHVQDHTTFLSPVTYNWAQIQSIMAPTMDAIFSFQADMDSLDPANARVNGLLTNPHAELDAEPDVEPGSEDG